MTKQSQRRIASCLGWSGGVEAGREEEKKKRRTWLRTREEHQEGGEEEAAASTFSCLPQLKLKWRVDNWKDLLTETWKEFWDRKVKSKSGWVCQRQGWYGPLGGSCRGRSWSNPRCKAALRAAWRRWRPHNSSQEEEKAWPRSPLVATQDRTGGAALHPDWL